MSMRTETFPRLLLAVLLAMACDDDDPPADVEGEYTIAITNGENPCGFQNWDEGASATGIVLTVTQDGSSLMAVVEGVAGGLIGLLIGSADYEGHVQGNVLVLENFGTRSFTRGDCAFTIKSTAQVQLSGDAIAGTIEYTPVTNGSPACEELESCVSEQLLSGTRPPTP
jgi:hypothetical protein